MGIDAVSVVQLPESEKASGAVICEKYADETLRIVEEYGKDFAPLTAEGEKKLRMKCYWYVIGLLSAINLLLFVSLRVVRLGAGMLMER